MDADHKTADPSSKDFTYDYAAVDGPINKNNGMRRVGTLEGKSDREEQIGNAMDTNENDKSSHIYHVLQEP